MTANRDGLAFPEPWIERGWNAVSRSDFLPDSVWVLDGARYRELHRASEPERWAHLVHDPAQPVVTQVDDGAPDPAGGDVPTSSVSAPTAVVDMLAELDLHPDQRVLEIGTGSGFNAALLATRVGADRVVSLEIDANLAAGARRALRRAGYGGVTVVAADGERGWEPGAPYDRLVATASVASIPWAWVEQVRPGGLVLSPLRTAFCSHGLVRLSVSEEAAEGRFTGATTFMSVRGQRGRPRIDAVFSAARWETSRRSRATFDVGLLSDPHAEFAVGTRLADVAHWPQGGAHWWCGHDAWAYAADDGTVYQWGPRDLADETAAALAWWERAGRPELFDFGLTVTAREHRVWLGDPARGWPLARA
ncbi:methyltransferase domain-containing protein [Streptomyces buecherae]|uniref:Protein-L-isoaspartate O-methyltransferase n=1 Tax=Streptomyces buecherae TaxID=2763006 RepID=A0A7H8N5F5_9ACTN|nr:methyltransferase domain-containing protein [Streptomyces buecherae]QKW49579.1 methyltransferase domain-containing protein [Streptomyces buecherae]